MDRRDKTCRRESQRMTAKRTVLLVALTLGAVATANADARRATGQETRRMLEGIPVPYLAYDCARHASVSDRRPRYGIIAVDPGPGCLEGSVNGALLVMKRRVVRSSANWRTVLDASQGVPCSTRKIPRDLLGRLVDCYGPRR